MSQYNQAKYLAKLKSKPSAVLALCAQSTFKSAELTRISRNKNQHIPLVLYLGNAILLILGVGEQRSWILAQPILRQVFPYIEGRLSESVAKGQGE